ncbi:MAG: hypothetical protein RIS52_1528, partial [Pseudomonadota bacterium]
KQPQYKTQNQVMGSRLRGNDEVYDKMFIL